MPSWQARIATFVVRRRVKPALGDLRDIARVRRVFATPLPVPRGVRVTPATVGGVAGEWVERVAADAAGSAPGPRPTTLLYIHGGGFVGCSPRSHRSLTASLALQGLRVFVPDYRLAPEHRFPAALDDVRAVWQALHGSAAGGRLVVAGDSAGGNLAMALMLALRDAGDALPDAAALFSPALDLTGGSRSLEANSQRDAMFDGPSLQHLADAYLGGADPAHPLVSPLFGDLAGLPPLLVHVGRDEVLRDDSLRLAQKARAAGVVVELRVVAGVAHVWQLLWRLPEARRSVQAAARFLQTAERGRTVEHHDVLIVGAGLSGIGAAAHLQDRCPDRSWTIVEARQALGGTWDLFRYPGVRSDSDMVTLGYAFKPWTGTQTIVDGATIRRYIEETAVERGIDHRIQYGQRVVRADWSSAQSRWLVDLAGPDGQVRRTTCNVLLMCSGYYRYDRGHRPAFPGEADYRGTLVHPQFWPDGLDHAGRRVLVIGSGATAVTLVPAMARTAAHVTMLQRSPSDVVPLPARDPLAVRLQRLHVPAGLRYRLVRWRNIAFAILTFQLARRWPAMVRRRLLDLVRRQLGPGHDTAAFSPRYNPWEQRVCVAPDGDLFKAIRSGRASVVTDTIETFTAGGVRLASGRTIDADIVVTATGLEMNVLGDAALAVDGVAVDPARTMAYKGLMFGGVPNLVSTFGYTNASWTLRADLVAGWTCRLLNHMDRHGWTVAVPRPDPSVPAMPFLDFSSGYVRRAIDRLPAQGTRRPWRVDQNYLLDLLTLRFGRLNDGTLAFARAGDGTAGAAAATPGRATAP